MPPASDIRRADPFFDNRSFYNAPVGYAAPVFAAGPVGPTHSVSQSLPHQHQHPAHRPAPPEGMYYPPVGGLPPPLAAPGPLGGAPGEPLPHPSSHPSVAPPSGGRVAGGGGGVQWIEEESKESTDTVLVRITEIHQPVTEEDMRRVFESVGTSARQLIIRPGRHEDEMVVVASFSDIYAAELVINSLNMRNIYDNGNKMMMSFITRRPVSGGGGPVGSYGGPTMMGMNGSGGSPSLKPPNGGGGRGLMGGLPAGLSSGPSCAPFPPMSSPVPMEMGVEPYDPHGPPASRPPFSGPGGRMNPIHPPSAADLAMGGAPPNGMPSMPRRMMGPMNERDPMQPPPPPPVPQPYYPPGHVGGAVPPEMRGAEGGGRGGMPRPYYSGEGGAGFPPPPSLPPPPPPFGRGRGRGGGAFGRGGRGRERGGGPFTPFGSFPDHLAHASPHLPSFGRGGAMMRDHDRAYPPPNTPYGPPHPMAGPEFVAMQSSTPYLSVKTLPITESLHSLFVLLEAFGGVVSIRRNQKNKEIVTVKMASTQNADSVVEYLQQIPFAGTTVSAKRFPSYVEQTSCTDDGDSRDPDTLQFDFTAAQHRSPLQRSKCSPSSWVKITGCGDLTESDVTGYLSENNFFPTRIMKVEDFSGSKNGRNSDCFIVQLADVETAVKLLITCQGSVCGLEKTNVIFIAAKGSDYQGMTFQGSGVSGAERNEE